MEIRSVTLFCDAPRVAGFADRENDARMRLICAGDSATRSNGYG